MLERELDDLAWVANPHTWRNNRGAIKTAKGYLRYGIPTPAKPDKLKGGDRLGWRQVTITPDMVGQTVAVFLSIELKTVNDHKAQGQIDWANFVRENGGLAEFWLEQKDGSVKVETC